MARGVYDRAAAKARREENLRKSTGLQGPILTLEVELSSADGWMEKVNTIFQSCVAAGRVTRIDARNVPPVFNLLALDKPTEPATLRVSEVSPEREQNVNRQGDEQGGQEIRGGLPRVGD